jgi:hypothetical protein
LQCHAAGCSKEFKREDKRKQHERTAHKALPEKAADIIVDLSNSVASSQMGSIAEYSLHDAMDINTPTPLQSQSHPEIGNSLHTISELMNRVTLLEEEKALLKEEKVSLMEEKDLLMEENAKYLKEVQDLKSVLLTQLLKEQVGIENG